MAVASCFATSLAKLKMKPNMDSTTFLGCGASTSYSSTPSFVPSFIRFCNKKPLKVETMVSKRPLSLNPTCEVRVALDASVHHDRTKSKASSVSGLKLLKTSAADNRLHWEIDLTVTIGDNDGGDHQRCNFCCRKNN